MRLIQTSLNRIELLPDNKQEADLLDLWYLGGRPGLMHTSSTNFQNEKLSIDFDFEKGAARRREINKEIAGIDSVYRP